MSDEGYISGLTPFGWHEGGRTCAEQHPSNNVQWCTDCLRAALAAAESRALAAEARLAAIADASTEALRTVMA